MRQFALTPKYVKYPLNADVQIVTDPIGYEIYLPPDLCEEGTPEPFATQMASRFYHVLETPACIIELSSYERCYFRSLGWNCTVLISVIFQNEKWVADQCQKNPSKEYILELLQTGKFIAGGSLD